MLTGEILAGEIGPGTARRLIRGWAAQHRSDLEANWARMKAGQALERIRSLEWRVNIRPQVVRADYRGGHRIHPETLYSARGVEEAA